MADDGEVRIKTTIDNSQLDKGLKNAESKIKKSTKTINDGAKSTQKFGGALKDAAVNSNSFSSGLANAAKSGGIYAAAIAAATIGVKKLIEGIRETSEAFKVQEKAEMSLQTAAKNNPYLDGNSVRRLKEFAGELQQISNIGDETAIKVETQLAATGRTEEEIIKIMRAAADMSAATGEDIQSAAQKLNATYSGNLGLMGRQIDELKGLTSEQLKNGEAIDLIAEKYKGMAKATIDARTQAKNAKGDFLEALGRISKSAADNWDKMWKGFFEKGIEAVDKVERHIEGKAWRKAITEQMKRDDFKPMMEQFANNPNVMPKLSDKTLEEWKNNFEKTIEYCSDLMTDDMVMAYTNTTIEIERRTQEKEKQRKQKEKELAEAEANKNAQDAKDKYTETINAKKQEIELRRKTGEEITAEQEAQELLNAKTAAFMELAKGFKDVNNIYIDGKNVLDDIAESAEKAYTEELKARNEAEKLKEAVEAEANAKDKLTELSALGDNRTESEKFRDQIKELQDAYQEYLKVTGDSLDEQYEMERQLKEKLSELWKEYRDAQEQEERKKNEKRKKQIQDVADFTTQSMTKAADIMKQASDLMLQTAKSEANAELAALETKFLKGEISEEEYEKKKLETKKKAAKEEYKIQMFQWSASILQATANIAQGVTQAIAQGGIAGIITGALVAAAGSVQIASIIASKPTPPSFASGGIVQGNSYTGDKVRANVNSGEMILNATQQKALWEVANGRNANGNNGANIIINNSAANIVNAQPRLTKDQIEIMIDARVNDSLKNGRYDQSLTMANQGMGGEFYGI